VKTKIEKDTGGGCSVCGHLSAVNVQGSYWLCGECVNDRFDRHDEIVGAFRVLLREYGPL
jgi:hypothetical protein